METGEQGVAKEEQEKVVAPTAEGDTPGAGATCARPLEKKTKKKLPLSYPTLLELEFA